MDGLNCSEVSSLVFNPPLEAEAWGAVSTQSLLHWHIRWKKRIKLIEEHRKEEADMKRESYLIFRHSHRKMDHPLNTSPFLLSQRSSPGNFCHLQSEFTKEVVQNMCLLKPLQLTSYLFLIPKKKKSFYFQSGSDQTWGCSILFSHLRMILKTVGISEVPFEVHASSQLVSHIILFLSCKTKMTFSPEFRGFCQTLILLHIWTMH